jgi:hypothetical protein
VKPWSSWIEAAPAGERATTAGGGLGGVEGTGGRRGEDPRAEASRGRRGGGPRGWHEQFPAFPFLPILALISGVAKNIEARRLGAVVVDGRGRWIGWRSGLIFF